MPILHHTYKYTTYFSCNGKGAEGRQRSSNIVRLLITDGADLTMRIRHGHRFMQLG